ncbi:MAG: 50S ribosomal protein L10 [Bacilli bacterium]|nr:50S ribosomal protein L10 [Bacilli bacterium]
MNKTVLEAKQNLVKEIVSKAKESEAIVVAEYRGLTVSQIQELRRALRKEDATMFVYKNSLVERASKELGYDGLDSILTGPNAIIFSKDVCAGAKITRKYAKRYGDVLIIKGGVVEGKFADADMMNEVAKLPGRDGLLSMLLSCLQAPVRQFACTVKAVADAK